MAKESVASGLPESKYRKVENARYISHKLAFDTDPGTSISGHLNIKKDAQLPMVTIKWATVDEPRSAIQRIELLSAHLFNRGLVVGMNDGRIRYHIFGARSLEEYHDILVANHMEHEPTPKGSRRSRSSSHQEAEVACFSKVVMLGCGLLSVHGIGSSGSPHSLGLEDGYYIINLPYFDDINQDVIKEVAAETCMPELRNTAAEHIDALQAGFEKIYAGLE